MAEEVIAFGLFVEELGPATALPLTAEDACITLLVEVVGSEARVLRFSEEIAAVDTAGEGGTLVAATAGAGEPARERSLLVFVVAVTSALASSHCCCCDIAAAAGGGAGEFNEI